MSDGLAFTELREEAAEAYPNTTPELGIIAHTDPDELRLSIWELYHANTVAELEKENAEIDYLQARQKGVHTSDSGEALALAARRSLTADEEHSAFIDSSASDLSLAVKVDRKIDKMEKPLRLVVLCSSFVLCQLGIFASERIAETAGLSEKNALGLSLLDNHDTSDGIKYLGAFLVMKYVGDRVMWRIRGPFAHKRAKKLAAKNEVDSVIKSGL